MLRRSAPRDRSATSTRVYARVSSVSAVRHMQPIPATYRAEAREGRDALALWREQGKGLEWTYLSPAAEIGPGDRTGHYRTTDDTLLLDAKGRSFISFEDYAVAVLDELEDAQHIGRRFGVAY